MLSLWFFCENLLIKNIYKLISLFQFKVLMGSVVKSIVRALNTHKIDFIFFSRITKKRKQ